MESESRSQRPLFLANRPNCFFLLLLAGSRFFRTQPFPVMIDENSNIFCGSGAAVPTSYTLSENASVAKIDTVYPAFSISPLRQLWSVEDE
jgi:hypothetical protein